jgi:hypothetical protein
MTSPFEKQKPYSEEEALVEAEYARKLYEQVAGKGRQPEKPEEYEHITALAEILITKEVEQKAEELHKRLALRDQIVSDPSVQAAIRLLARQILLVEKRLKEEGTVSEVENIPREEDIIEIPPEHRMVAFDPRKGFLTQMELEDIKRRRKMGGS